MVAWILIGLLILVVAAVPVAAVLGILSFVLDEIAMDGRLTLGIGEIVWDLLPDGRYLGGAPLNVAVNLHRLGVPVHMISAVGNDELGDEVLHVIADMNMPISGIQCNELPTGVVEVSLDDQGLPDYEIKHPSAWDAIEISSRIEGSPWQEQDSFNPKEPPKYLVVGSLVFRSERSRSFLWSFMEHRDSSTILILDVNLRKDG